jgi:hypothetical protein
VVGVLPQDDHAHVVGRVSSSAQWARREDSGASIEARPQKAQQLAATRAGEEGLHQRLPARRHGPVAGSLLCNCVDAPVDHLWSKWPPALIQYAQAALFL